MLDQIRGLHHVTAMAGDARRNNGFYTRMLGLRRVKKTVNFDAPDVYHLYYADGAGTPGSVMTFFAFPDSGPGVPGTGESSLTSFAVPPGALPFWRERLGSGAEIDEVFGQARLRFHGPDGERLALAEAPDDPRAPWTGDGVADAEALRGFHGVTLTLRDGQATGELLQFMGYREDGREGRLTRFRRLGGNGADVIDIEINPEARHARLGAGSVHHIAFSVDNRAAQLDVSRALGEIGFGTTPVIDRDYFYAIYFRSPGGVLFEVATGEPGFARDENPEHLGQALKLPAQHAHLRPFLEKHLEPLEG